ncbi:hypothetical protein [Pandoraea commovens]|uniref:Uncharacterized protein n=1 Tax=Pandoraea commovens TaxID=2508289 RepID=A0A5E4WQJ6_9BURK|nr:hypothetical protein [Pandoraea commovens]VVE25960.1 hypothetical protein PCO31010_03419 [Pandoraea commovens]
MTFINPLEVVYQAYRVSHESLFVVAYIARDHVDGVLVPRAGLFSAVREDVETALVNAEKQAADLAVFALFATFERYVVERLQTANELLASGHPAGYSRKLAEKFKSEVEYWRFDEILDLFKPELDVNLIGRAKQIKRYRDWIAHRNTNKEPPTKVSPDTVFEVLSKVVDEISQTHDVPSGADRKMLASPQSPISVCRDHPKVYRQA